jgi:ribosome biogenesis GTPase
VLVDGRMVRCWLRGRLKKGEQRDASPIAAGDRVALTMLEPARGVVERVLARESDLARAAAGSIPLRQTIAANVEQAVIVFAAAEPRADLYPLDRFLVVATAGGLERIICVNKCDLVEREALGEQFDLYRDLGYRVLFTSAVGSDGMDDLREVLRDRRSVICGPSGVGKSSLLNALAPELSLRTGEVGAVTHKGRHTTTSVTLMPLPFGGWVADTPGLRQLGFWEVAPEQVAAAFPELLPHLGQCRFHDCSHRAEPGCALQAAARSGEVDRRRLRSFLEMGGK